MCFSVPSISVIWNHQNGYIKEEIKVLFVNGFVIQCNVQQERCNYKDVNDVECIIS